MTQAEIGTWERAVLMELNKFGGSPILDRPDHPWLAICKDRPFMTGSFKSFDEAVAYASWCIANDTSTEAPENNFVVCCLRAFFTRIEITPPEDSDDTGAVYTQVVPTIVANRAAQ